jgi:hypothetical protein
MLTCTVNGSHLDGVSAGIVGRVRSCLRMALSELFDRMFDIPESHVPYPLIG